MKSREYIEIAALLAAALNAQSASRRWVEAPQDAGRKADAESAQLLFYATIATVGFIERRQVARWFK